MGLSQEQIDELLAGQLKKISTRGAPKPPQEHLPRSIQLGAIRYREDSRPCAGARGLGNCKSPTTIEVNNIPQCYSHALYSLNRIILEQLLDFDFGECTCSAGKYSNMSVHNPDCQAFNDYKELRDAKVHSNASTC